jgi:hypothetical protein
MAKELDEFEFAGELTHPLKFDADINVTQLDPVFDVPRNTN